MKLGIVSHFQCSAKVHFLTQLQMQVLSSANYPFCTIEPNIGVVAVPDKKDLINLRKMYDPDKYTLSIEFVDIAGLWPRQRGEDLGQTISSIP